ncbi:MAG: UDP-N-acetylglucosamine 1-carboxyvinyltransferase [Patescibacteria group bacterium]
MQELEEKNHTNKIENFEVEGGRKLSGTIRTNASKNGSVGLLCAALLNRGRTVLHGISRIEEVFRMIEVLESIGVKIEWTAQHSVEVSIPEKFELNKLNRDSAIKTRSIVMIAGPLVHYLKSFYLPHAQGCHLGKRTIAAHIYGLEELGVEIKVTNQKYTFSQNKLKAAKIVMYESGDTACENLLTAAALIPGRTTIKFASSNYQVQEICFFLEKLGVKIDGIGTTSLTVHGVSEIKKDIEYYNSEDPIESMMWITAAIATNSPLEITRCPIDFLELELYKLKKMGLRFKISKPYKAKNERTTLTDLVIKPSRLRALDDKIEARPFPGLNIDNLPFFSLIAACARGQTLLHDWVFENRAIYLTELNRLGANILLADPHRLFIQGPTEWKPAQVVCPPALRPSVVIMLAMLAGSGTSTLRNVYMINRGHENIVERFNSIGAKIRTTHD